LNTLSSERLKDSGAKALVFDDENNGTSARKQALDENLTHLITSPEILNSVEFRTEVLSKEMFLRRLTMVALDEMHLAQQWSTFQSKYGKLHKLRTRIPKAVPWFGTSVTLDPFTLTAAKEAAGFYRSSNSSHDGGLSRDLL
jgi:superfamily II DNA helicase RecQ